MGPLSSKTYWSNWNVQRRAMWYVSKHHRNRSSVMTWSPNWVGKVYMNGAEARLSMMYEIVKDKVAINKNMYLQRQTRLSRHTQQFGYMEQTATRLQEMAPLWTPPKTGTSFPPENCHSRVNWNIQITSDQPYNSRWKYAFTCF